MTWFEVWVTYKGQLYKERLKGINEKEIRQYISMWTNYDGVVSIREIKEEE